MNTPADARPLHRGATPSDDGAERSAADTLRWMLSPVSAEEFLRDAWEKKPVVVARQRPDYYASLLSLEEVDRVITTLSLTKTELSMVSAARNVTEADYTFPSGLVDAVRLYKLFTDGATVILPQLHLRVPALATHCRLLERALSLRCQTNIYLSPPRAQGFRTHYDNHDVFVLQVAGSKRWRLYDTPIPLPLRGQSFEENPVPTGPISQEFELRAGDLVYVPRGVLHDAVATDDISLHITVGVLNRTWADLMLEALSAVCVQDLAFHYSLPVGFATPGFDRAQLREHFRELLQRFVASANVDHALDGFVEDLVATRHPLIQGQIAQVQRLATLSLNSAMAPHPGLIYELIEEPGALTVHCYGHDVRFPAHAADAVRFALTTPRFAVRDLPGSIDDASRVVLARQFVREGMTRLV